MKTKRFSHECVLIEDTDIKTIYVAGGFDENDNLLDSIETLKLANANINQNEWKLEKIFLPMPLHSFQMVRSNDKNILFYVVGGDPTKENMNQPYSKKIYGLTKLKSWEEMGSLREGRASHQTVNVPLSYLKGCQ